VSLLEGEEMVVEMRMVTPSRTWYVQMLVAADQDQEGRRVWKRKALASSSQILVCLPSVSTAQAISNG